jgi:predicted metal-dependent hydrolase
MPALIIGSTAIPYEVSRSARARRLRITVRPDGVRVSAPPWATTREIGAFVDLNRGWIADRVAAIERVLAAHPGPPRLQDGARIPYQGRLVPLTLTKGKLQRPQVAYRDDGFLVSMPQGIEDGAKEALVEQALGGWLRRQATIEAEALVERYGPRHGLIPNAVRIKNQKQLWGSCTARGVINLNWRLILAPPPVLEYVVVHEICHLRVRNHQKEFWRLVAEVLPEYGPQRRWLKERGHLLSLRRASFD